MPRRTPASRKALLDAFETLLSRHGAGQVGVNAVLDTAGVGKQLLYRYFGDLQGLATAWSQERRDPIGLGERERRLVAELAALPRGQRVAEILVDYATMLREHPWAIQVLLAEMSHPGTLGNSMREIRREIGRAHEGLLLNTGSMTGEAALARAFVLHAAAAYLAMRARLAPDYNGLDLASEEGWSAAMALLRKAGRPSRSRIKTNTPSQASTAAADQAASRGSSSSRPSSRRPSSRRSASSRRR
jgi:AcrR family transcriptional regulator